MLEKLTPADADSVYDLMLLSFPENELRSREDHKNMFSDARFNAYGVKNESAGLSAFITFWRLNGFTFGEHFAVDPSLRGAGLGARLLGEFLELCELPAVLEVEPPETDTARRRIGFYERSGFVLNGYDYTQPPLGRGRSAVRLMVMSFPRPLDKSAFERVRGELYKEVYRASDI